MPPEPIDPATSTARIDARLTALADWRGAALAQLRRLVHEADPGVVERVKWVKPTNPDGVISWEHAGILCTGEIYRTYVKLTFAHGAALDDPAGLFNAGFGGGTRRAIDVREDAAIDPAAFRALIDRAVAYNLAKRSAKARS